VIYREFSRLCGEDDIPYYPIRLVKEKEQLGQYVELARREPNATFVGRLGTYRYLDMDVTIFEALKVAAGAKDALTNGESVPSFFVDPLGS
jgi:UDP-galactopyranose mutase